MPSLIDINPSDSQTVEYYSVKVMVTAESSLICMKVGLTA